MTVEQYASFSQVVSRRNDTLLDGKVTLDHLYTMPADQRNTLLAYADATCQEYFSERAEALRVNREWYQARLAKVDALFAELQLPKTTGVKVKRNTKAYGAMLDAIRTPYVTHSYEEIYVRIKLNGEFQGFRVSPSAYATDRPQSSPLRTLSEQINELFAQIQRDEDRSLKANHIRVASLEYVTRHNIVPAEELTQLSDESIITLAREHAARSWMQEHYPSGAHVDMDDNICECASYVIGDRRCDCGNRRISAYAEGDLVSGFYLALEPY